MTIALTSPIALEYLTWPMAAGLLAALSVPILLLGMRSLFVRASRAHAPCAVAAEASFAHDEPTLAVL